ncbi:tRNA (adenosine(37)-N6)-threonylcarbamoyltransferase complex ATPase subunit type 1 TsaE [Lysobacter sp. H21R4]|uniref:tRNA (adenosine(37)-N6)-threonylcarbamoyltransferase complex ATPase subunit type 1 TsaE n=1 Tax=Lysobacter sp. H21R4 TaxID=2781021 RepID=UPI0018887B2B|nr:tRNA (adenosine(37)-N6)-threonylcarbamoyltransferase complex ATPase subunit type 1 TsaE [Lysobacter sp. H21R4]QOY61951.1 tRNA (adenosine(37)-N6)-threonylcarbamoyltransferase complex ATPase subunit type 1 TsaE [Lysobacter sp. H21R4]
MKVFTLADSSRTDRLGQALARARPQHAVVHLEGDLGAGKSTLARALLRELGVRGAIRSPTYTLVERYPLAGGGEAWHLDLYRIGDPAELEYLGLDSADVTLWLVEWADRGRGGLPPADIQVQLETEGDGRRAQLSAHSDAGRVWLQRLAGDDAIADVS